MRANATFCGWVGRPASELVDHVRFSDLLGVGARIFYQTHFAPLLRMQGTVSEVKLHVHGSDGHPLPMMVNARRHVVDERVVHDLALFVARDRDKYERELMLTKGRLEVAIGEANRLRHEAEDRALLAEQLIGIVSHDLRTPLSTIAMGAGILGESCGERERETVARIGRATRRASRLIEDLLDFSGARLGRGLSISREPIDLHEVVGQIVADLATAHQGRLRHVRKGDGACRADRHRLAQVVDNLVSNATTYGEAGGIVTVTTEIDCDTAALAVHNGGEITVVDRRALFQPMMRGTDGGTQRSVGLGLFIVAEIARAHGGVADVASSAEEGTTFRVAFPRV